MINQEMIDRINELYHKRITVGLTPEEEIEQAALRKEYLAGIRGQVAQQLDRIEIVDGEKEPEHGGECQCGHCHKH